ETVADLGSGTGFYTDDVASFGEASNVSVYAVDMQDAMHDYYREKGVPENVALVTATIDDLPFDDDELDAAFSTMTFHEFASEDALAEVGRVLSTRWPVQRIASASKHA
ncbi:class I SAM-dependent methyltransferase, partial [Haladaptatus sp. W1]|uniref:class I SAM-dependent methyltransferase n=1 Tax=Haladaptatus sp. W1 TaxID=1897478 RepID=UPI000A4ADAE8